MPIDVSFKSFYFLADETTIDYGFSNFSSSTDVVSVSTSSDDLNPGDPVDIVITSVVGGYTVVIPVAGQYVGQAADGSMMVSAGNDHPTWYFSDANYVEGDTIPAVSETPYVCFAAGTLIATPTGLVAVETLTVGDEILTADGARTVVKWVGHQTRSKTFGNAEKICPVRIHAGALAENVPMQDLIVTNDHGIVFDEAIVHASALINGTTITRVQKTELAERSTYYHVETEGHAVILANGCPAETYVDNVARSAFDNYAEFAAAYGENHADIQPLDLPRALGPRQIPMAIRTRIAARAEEIGLSLATAC